MNNNNNDISLQEEKVLDWLESFWKARKFN